MWKEYFKVIRIVPGEVIVPIHGKIDFRSDNISIDICKELFENDFPYLEITAKGMDYLYGTALKSSARMRTAL